jgi:hypothetical protein
LLEKPPRHLKAIYKNEKDKNATFKELATLRKAMNCAKRRLKA